MSNFLLNRFSLINIVYFCQMKKPIGMRNLLLVFFMLCAVLVWGQTQPEKPRKSMIKTTEEKVGSPLFLIVFFDNHLQKSLLSIPLKIAGDFMHTIFKQYTSLPSDICSCRISSVLFPVLSARSKEEDCILSVSVL